MEPRDRIGEILDDVRDIKSALLGDIEDPTKPGALERLRRVEDWQKTEKWGLGLLVAAFIGDFGSRALAWIRKI